MNLNQWVMFENDICPDCDHPILAKLSPGAPDDPTLQIIISCDCDKTIFDHAWKNARDSDELIVVVGYTHMQMIELVVQMIAKNQKK